MSIYLTTTEARQGSSNFKLCLNFRLNGYSDTYLGQTWRVKIVCPDGSFLSKTSGLEVLSNTPTICVPIDDFDLIQSGTYHYQVSLITGGANVNSAVESFDIAPSLPESLPYSVISSAQNHIPIFTSSGGLVASDLILNGSGNLEYTTGGAKFHGAVVVDDESFSSAWNASMEVPTKNAVYDKIVSLTTANISPSTDRNYITDATAIVNTAVARSVFLESYANLSAAVSAIGSTVTDLIVTSATTTTASLTIPRNIRLIIQGAGQITVAAGHTLTIYLFEDPGNKKVFVLSNSSTSHLVFFKGATPEFNLAWLVGTDYGSTTATQFTNAMNAALYSCGATGNGRIYVPEGLWLTNGGHTIDENHSNLTIRGNGEGLLWYNTSIQLQQTNTFIFEIVTTADSTQTCELFFKDMSLDGNHNSSTYGVYGHGDRRTTIARIAFEAVAFANFTDGVFFNANGTEWQVQGVSFDAQCRFETNSHAGLHVDGVNAAYNVEANFYCGYNAYAVYANRCGVMTLKGCEFGGIGQYTSDGNQQVEKQTVVGTITNITPATVKSVVTAAGMAGSPRTVTANVNPSDSATTVATKLRRALDADPYVTTFFYVGGTGADILLIALDRAANDTTMNFTVQNDTSTGLTNNTTSTNLEAGHTITQGLAKAVLYSSGSHAPITFIGCQDEGFESSFVNDAPLLGQEVNWYSCLIQSAIRLNYTCRVNVHGCQIPPKVFRDGANSDSVVTVINSNVEGVQRTLGNPSDGYPVLLRSHNFTHVFGNSHLAMEIGNSSTDLYAVRNTFREPLQILSYLNADSTTPMLSVGHKSDQIGMRIGRIDEMDNIGYYYDISRNNSTGYLDIIGSQTGFTGINVPGVIITNIALVDIVSYGGTWSGSQWVPSMGAIYTKLESMTGKRVVGIASSATPTPNADTTDIYKLTALAVGATFGAPTGTPDDGQSLILRIKDDGTARSLAFNAIYRAVGVTLPTTTVVNKTLYIFLRYNAIATKWDVVDVKQE